VKDIRVIVFLDNFGGRQLLWTRNGVGLEGGLICCLALEFELRFVAVV
jgi:hypothetical protein